MLGKTLITMHDGSYRQLQELNPGDVVKGAQGRNNKVLEIIKSKARRLFHINDLLSVTGMTPFLMCDRSTVAIPERRSDLSFSTMTKGYGCYDEFGTTFLVKSIEEEILDESIEVLALILDGDQSFFAEGFALKCWFPVKSRDKLNKKMEND